MASSSDLLTQIRSELDARLRELRPLLAEYERLLGAAAALDTAGEDPPAAPRRRPAATRGRPRKARVARASTAAPARPAASPLAPAETSSPASAASPTPAPASTPAGAASARAASASALAVAAPAPRRGRPAGGASSDRSAPGNPAQVSAKATPRIRGDAPKRARRGATSVAIVAALEHGSHTVSELAIVTAMSSQIINSNLRRLQQAGAVTRTKREGDGKAAYALTAAAV